jgi:hypothetical protein
MMAYLELFTLIYRVIEKYVLLEVPPTSSDYLDYIVKKLVFSTYSRCLYIHKEN